MIVKEIMNPEVYKISEKETIINAFNTMHEKGIKRIFVEDDCGKIIGVMSYRDLVNVLMSKSLYELMNINENIKNIAVKEILKINENENIKDAAKIMIHADVSALLVVDDEDNPVGVISQTDVLRSIIKET